MNRVGYVFLICLALAIGVSLLLRKRASTSTIDVSEIDYSTRAGFNIASLAVIAVLCALYATWW